MNFLAVIILAAVFADFILHLLADILNLKMLRNDLPEEFKEVYDTDRYRRSQIYLRVNIRFGWIASFIDLALLLVFWFGRGFPFLDGLIRGLNQGPVLTGLLYMGTLIVFKALISLPFKIYDTFVIEEKFGFNKTTWKIFILDIIKGTFIALLLGTPLLASILAFFEYTGSNAWLYCWGAVTLYLLIVQFIAPTWILPLFNKFNPVEEGALKDAIMSYAKSIQFPLENIYVMDGSKRSGKSNAFFMGYGSHKRIVLFDTLIEQHTIPELVAILAHEMGHYKKKHIQKMLSAGILQIGLMFYLLFLFISCQPLFDAFYMEYISIYAGFIFFGMLYAPIDFFMSIFIQAFSRTNEYEADRFAVETTNDSVSMVNALKKLSVSNLANLVPHPLYVFLNNSHPPVLERIRAIKDITDPAK